MVEFDVTFENNAIRHFNYNTHGEAIASAMYHKTLGLKVSPLRVSVEIGTVYSEKDDMTFIMKSYNEGEKYFKEVVGFYFGEPTKENTEEYYGKLKAQTTPPCGF